MSRFTDSFIVNNFKTTKDFVSSVLREYPETRSCDTLLYAKCLQKMGIKTVNQIAKNPHRLNIITVHKCRQKLNQEGLYLPPKYVQSNRKSNGKEIKVAMAEGEI